MKVEAIRSYVNNVNFGKKVNKEHQVVSRPQTSSLKAIPLAVLIAMSPLNTSVQNASAQTSSTTKVEQMMKLAEKDQLVGYTIYEKPSVYCNKCLIQLYSLDGSDNYDRIMLTFAALPAKEKDLEAHNIPSNLFCDAKVTLKLDTLKKVTNYKIIDGEKTLFSEEYYAVGLAKKRFSNFNDKTTYELVSNSADLNFEMMSDNEEVSITKKFYDDLKESFGNLVECSEVENVTQVKRHVLDDYWLGY